MLRHMKARFMATQVSVNLILLPGPVSISATVQQAFVASPVSHRSRDFIETLNDTKQALCRLTQARATEILVGTGTLANDVIASQLSLQSGPGLILSNGEFGERLLDHAHRSGLTFKSQQQPWGKVFEEASIREMVKAQRPAWLWATHCETSTGMLNDIEMLKAICREYDIRLCLDCISSIGTTALDLRGVHLASASSNKGLGAYPGLAIVFYEPPISPAPQKLPRYLDLGLYAAGAGTPFTHSSNLVSALNVAVAESGGHTYRANEKLSMWLREELQMAGFQLVVPPEYSSPAITTLALPPRVSSVQVGEKLENKGYWLSYRSDYLIQRNWIQICTMTACDIEPMQPLPGLLQQLCSDARPHQLSAIITNAK